MVMKEYEQCPLYQANNPQCCGLRHELERKSYEDDPARFHTIYFEDGEEKTVPLWVVSGLEKHDGQWISFIQESAEAGEVLDEINPFGKSRRVDKESERVLNDTHPGIEITRLNPDCPFRNTPDFSKQVRNRM